MLCETIYACSLVCVVYLNNAAVALCLLVLLALVRVIAVSNVPLPEVLQYGPCRE